MFFVTDVPQVNLINGEAKQKIPHTLLLWIIILEQGNGLLYVKHVMTIISRKTSIKCMQS